MKRIILLGGGGHARVIYEMASLSPRMEAIGYTDVEQRLFPLPYLGRDESIEAFSPQSVLLVNGIGSPPLRYEIYHRLKKGGYLFHSLIHPRAIVSADAKLSEGVQVMAGAVINPGSSVEENVIINTSSSIDHDCWIGAHAHIAPGVTLCGSVRIGRGCHIGAGATIIQGITIGEGTIVGAGSVVLRDMPSRVKAFGSPAEIRDSV